MIRDAAISSIARVIFFVVEIDARRCLSSRKLAGIRPSYGLRPSRSGPTLSSLFAKQKDMFRSSLLHSPARDPRDSPGLAPPLPDDLFLLDLALIQRLVLLAARTGEHLS